MVREQISRLNQLGQMPDQSDDTVTDETIDSYADALSKIEAPITQQEGEILVRLFPQVSLFGVEWRLLHLIESLFNTVDFDIYENLINNCPSDEWKEAMSARLRNWKKKQGQG